MILFIIQLLTTFFSAYVLLPLFETTSLSGIFSFLSLDSLGVSALIVALIISVFRLLVGFLFSRKVSVIYNLIFILINVITGVVILI